jgi:hypothetical protein
VKTEIKNDSQISSSREGADPGNKNPPTHPAAMDLDLGRRLFFVKNVAMKGITPGIVSNLFGVRFVGKKRMSLLNVFGLSKANLLCLLWAWRLMD